MSNRRYENIKVNLQNDTAIKKSQAFQFAYNPQHLSISSRPSLLINMNQCHDGTQKSLYNCESDHVEVHLHC